MQWVLSSAKLAQITDCRSANNAIFALSRRSCVFRRAA